MKTGTKKPPAAVPAARRGGTPVVTHTASLEHPSKPRAYVFRKLVGGAYWVERWEGGRLASERLLHSREAANGLWHFLRDRHGYAEFGAMSEGRCRG